MFDLTGKTALVTGATGGIGAEIARALHAQGAHVVLSGTREAVLRELAAQLGEQTSIAAANLSDPASVDGLVAAAESAAGKPLDFRLSRAALRGMMKRRWGRIIGITSVVGVTGNGGQTNYAASKAGMIGFSKALAQEVASRNITVNCIAPGFIESPMTDSLNDQQKEGIMGTIPAGRLGRGAEIAASCVYLASEEAAYVTGQTWHVNGGMAMI